MNRLIINKDSNIYFHEDDIKTPLVQHEENRLIAPNFNFKKKNIQINNAHSSQFIRRAISHPRKSKWDNHNDPVLEEYFSNKNIFEENKSKPIVDKYGLPIVNEKSISSSSSYKS